MYVRFTPPRLLACLALLAPTAAFAQPANNDCANAFPVGNGNIAYTTVGAWQDYFGPCANGSNAADVWYDYTAAADGFARLRPDVDAPTDLMFTVLDGSCFGNELACGSDAIRGTRQVVFPTVAGQHYIIRVSDNTLEGTTGHFTLAPVSAPANDSCQSAQQIAGLGQFNYDNTLADNSGPDDGFACQGIGGMAINHDVWFRWTSTLAAGRDAVVSTCGLTFADTKIAVYADGCPVGAPIDCNDDWCFAQSRVSFTPAPGQSYMIRVGHWAGFNGNDGPDGEPGAFSIESIDSCSLSAPAGAFIEPEACGQSINDGCGMFTDVPCGTTTIFGTSPVINGQPDQDQYRITLPVRTHVVFKGTAEFPMRMAILDDSCPPNLMVGQRIASLPCADPDNNPLDIELDPGTYAFAVVNTRTDSPCEAHNNYVVTLTVDDCTPRGQCCMGVTCQVMTQAECGASGGTYAGDFTTCPPPEGNYVASVTTAPVEDISGVGTLATGCDDCGTLVDIGFTFNFYTHPFTQVHVSSNGFLTFSDETYDGAFFNQDLPSEFFKNMLAVWWDDFRTDSGAGQLYTATLGTAPNRRFVAMWKNLESVEAPGTSSTFEAVLHETTNEVEYRYAEIEATNSATAGVSNGDGTVGAMFPQAGANTTLTLSLVAEPSSCGTCTSDFNGDGDFGTDQDIEAFFACLGGNCCATCGSADFNRDGDTGTDQDIESFFRVLGGGAC